MEIQYLKKLKNYYDNNPKISKIGVPEQEIQTLEQELKIKSRWRGFAIRAFIVK